MTLINANRVYVWRFLALYFSAASAWLLAHDNTAVHPALTAKAWAVLPEAKRTAILYELGITDDFRLDFHVSEMTENPDAVGFMKQGSIDEDAGMRCFGHFYNPLAANHALTKPTMGAPDSFQWATIGTSIYSPLQNNEENWSDVRRYYYNAITYYSPADRLEQTGHMFYALGKIVHLLQDLSQPEHTRNDAHIINGTVLPKARWIENYGAIKGASIIRDLNEISPLDWRSAGFKSVENFWNRKKYTDDSQGSVDALNDDASGDVTKTLGLAEFSNGNFLGCDASYRELTLGVLSFPHPAVSDTNCPSNVSLLQLASTLVSSNTGAGRDGRQFIFLSKTKSGISVKHHSILTYTGFKRLQLGRSIDPNAGHRLAEVTINSASVLQEYHEILLKKAVEYSAGLLDYFFRGKLSADCYFDEITGKYHLLVSNVSGQPFHVGSFEVYWDDAAGNRTKYIGVTDDYSTQGATRTLESGYGVEGWGEYFQWYYSWDEDLGFPCVKIEIPVPNKAAALAATKAIVVYKEGIIGGKTNDQADDLVDGGKAVAAVHFDLPKIVVPVPSIEAMSRSASKSKYGFSEFTGYISSPPKKYLISTRSVTNNYSETSLNVGNWSNYGGGCCMTSTYTGTLNSSGQQDTIINPVTGATTYSTAPADAPNTGTTVRSYSNSPGGSCSYSNTIETSTLNIPWYGGHYEGITTTLTSTTKTITSSRSINNTFTYSSVDCPGDGYVHVTASMNEVLTLSSEYDTATLISSTVAAFPAYGSTWYSSTSASRNLPTSELSYSIQESKYHFRFNPGSVPAGLGYRISWVERFIPALTYNANNQITGGGAALSRVDVVKGGAGYKTATVDSYLDGTSGVVVYVKDGGNGYAVAPTVTLPAPQAPNGTQSTAHAVISNGAVSEIIMDNSGSGYTDAPVLTLAAPTGSANPVIEISAPGNGGTTATATATLNAAGQIQSISLNASGSRYTQTPSVYMSSSPNGLGQGASFAVHLGTETEKTATWSGPVLGNYSAADSSTWPVLGPYDLAVPATNGTSTVQNVKAEITASGP